MSRSRLYDVLYDVCTECIERVETDKRLSPAEQTFAAAVIASGFWAQSGNDVWERALADAKAMVERRGRAASARREGRQPVTSKARTNHRPNSKAKKAVRRATA
jgi:hypothetical protein